MCSDLIRYQVSGIILLLLCAAICECGAVEVQAQQQEEPQPKPVIAITDLDFNNDGYINQIDLLILKYHFNDRYTRYVPWDLNADLRCDKRDFDYFAARVPLNYKYEVAVNISVWNMTNYTIDQSKNATMILDEVVYPQNLNRTMTWIKHYTSLEPPKNNDAVCVHYTRDLCRLAYKYLGPKTIAWGSSGAHAYGMIYTGGDWRSLSNWDIIDPYWDLYDTQFLAATGMHETNSIHILLDEGRYGYWAITLSVDYWNNTINDSYKAEYRIGTYRE
jgi:hypothetical protein